MVASNRRGPGRTIPSSDSVNDRQVLSFDTSQPYGLRIKDNGARKVTAILTGAYTAAFGEVVLGDTTAAGFNVTLPTITSADQAPVTVKRKAGSNNITVIGTIDGGTNTTVSTVVKTFVSNGTSWETI